VFFQGENKKWLCSAHDFFHIERVVTLAEKLCEKEWEWNIFIVRAGALLHEALDDKFFAQSDMAQRKDSLRIFLSEQWIEASDVDSIMFIVENVGYSKSLERWEDFVWSKEFEIVEDADRLESIWAMAIARTFAFWWKKKLPLYDPSIPPKMNLTREEYAKTENTSINHFYEKLLLLKDIMHTVTWTQVAQKRHAFMETYLDQFFSEWNWDL